MNIQTTQTKEHGEHIGTEAAYLRSVGAADSQICLFVQRSGVNIPAEYKDTYLAAARASFVKPSATFNQPIYELSRKRLRDMLAYWNQGVKHG